MTDGATVYGAWRRVWAFCRTTHTKHCQQINCWKNIKWGDNVMLHFVEVQFREVVDLGRVAERGAECDSL